MPEIMKLETRELKEVEIFETGTWKGNKYEEKDLNEAIENFNNHILKPYVNINHDNKLTKEMQKILKVFSFGNVSRLWKKGKKLMADFKQVPKLIAELIEAGALKQKSVEWWKEYKHANGKLYKNVLEAITFFGADGTPALSTLSDIVKLYKNELEEKSIEQDADQKICVEFKMEEKRMDIMEISKEEYQSLLKDKVTLDKFKLDVESKDEQIEMLKMKTKESIDELAKMKTEKEDLEKMKADFEAEKKEATEKEADDFVSGIVNDKKLLPKFKDMKVAEYIRLKSEDKDENLKLFKEELESRDEIIKFGQITGNEGEGDEDISEKIDYKTESDVAKNESANYEKIDKAVKVCMKKDKLSYNDAAVKLGYMEKSEVGGSIQ